MQSSIDDCTSSILDAEKALIEYDNAIRQINWDAFDRTRDDVEDLINETDFLVELLKDVGITDDDGNMTKEGQAAQAYLHRNINCILIRQRRIRMRFLKSMKIWQMTLMTKNCLTENKTLLIKNRKQLNLQ